MDAKFDFDRNIAEMCITRIPERIRLAHRFLMSRIDVQALTILDYDRPKDDTNYDFCDPAWLKGAHKFVYEYCLAQGMKPALVPSDKALSQESAHCRVFSIFIDVPPPPPEPAKVEEPKAEAPKTEETPKVEEPKAKEQETAKLA